MTMASDAQSPPTANDRPNIVDLVVRDLQERADAGKKKYGVKLQPHNGRDALVDAYQEAIDLCMYLRQEIEERGELQAEMTKVQAEMAKTKAALVELIHEVRQIKRDRGAAR